MDDIRV